MPNNINKQASSSDRHPAVVQGQEDLSGVKSVQIKRNLKKNSEDEFVVTQSVRTEMVYDTPELAKDAYLDIHNAKEEAEFDEDAATDSSTPKEETNTSKTEASYWGSDILKVAYMNPIEIDEQSLISGAENPTTEQNYIHPSSGPGAQDREALDTYTEHSGFNGNGGIGDVPQVPASYATAAEHEPKMSALLQKDFGVSTLEDELKMGVNVELEHTDNAAAATEIALDHLAEDEHYYSKLREVQPGAGETPEHKVHRKLEMNSDKSEPSLDFDKLGKETMFPWMK